MLLEIKSNDEITLKNQGELQTRILNILKTKKGEVPFDRKMGLDSEYIDMPIHLATPLILNDVRENMSRYFPEATIVDIGILKLKNDDLEIKVVIQVD